MMRRLLVATTVMVALLLVAHPTRAAEDTPTFNQHVGRILLDNCASCHRPNQVAPMSLLTYDESRPWARAIKSKVESREMPPWFADPRFGKFSNDISLTDEEIATIVAWADGGAPQGDGAAPDLPQFSEAGWSHPSGADPDYVIDFPIEWQVEPDGETPNFNLYTELPFDDVLNVSAVEVRPGNYAVVHHITTGLVNMPPGMKLGHGPAWPGGPMVDLVPVPDSDADVDTDQFNVLASRDRTARVDTDADAQAQARLAREGFGPYIPGVGAEVTRDNQVRQIRGDLFDYIIWNLHFQATGKPESARPSIGAWGADEDKVGTSFERSLSLNEYTSEGTQLVQTMTLEERAAARQSNQVGQGLNPLLGAIPPNEANWTVTGIGAFQNDAVIQSLFVHAHVRGNDFTYVLTYPDGREEILLRIPNYDFDWQFEYQLEEPIHAPAGSTVKSVSRYDNSRRNRANPAPHKEVYWSEQSWDDMFLTSVKYIVDESGSTQD